MIQTGGRGGLVRINEEEGDQDKVRTQRGARQVDRLCGNRQSATDWCAEEPGLRYRAGDLLERRRGPVAEVIGRDVRVRDVRGDEGATAASLDASGDGGVELWLASYVQSARCFRPSAGFEFEHRDDGGSRGDSPCNPWERPEQDSANPDPHPAAAHTRITANIRTCAPGTRG